MARIVFQAAAKDPVEVEVFGSLFLLQPVTRSVQSKLDANSSKLAEIVDGAGYDPLVEALCEGLDLLLKPSTGTTKASTVLKREWKADNIDHRYLLQFIDQLADASRPT